MSNDITSIGKALAVLRPGASWSLTGLNYDGLEWLDTNQSKPTQQEVDEEMAKQIADYPYQLCKEQASALLYETDWTTIPDVVDPTNTPYLKNQAEFISWRSQIRALAVNPIANPIFPPKPEAIWG